MANAQKLLIFSLAILVASMFNNNILVSGGEYENKVTYAFDVCLIDCKSKGYQTGTCIIVPDHKNPRARCCCGYLKP
ncbi:unnamed protein product [Eruca vesicaria subsp. sativa]|uniref:Defensin-like domain-containing protein n=1 Tax=Eruca vesicaria subsp. sativa TaxID=29727 RepID=A0ABC8M0L5_ERUVS|nr:unnamed protein product [Eruca vesicaria subsp. sativa]